MFHVQYVYWCCGGHVKVGGQGRWKLGSGAVVVFCSYVNWGLCVNKHTNKATIKKTQPFTNNTKKWQKKTVIKTSKKTHKLNWRGILSKQTYSLHKCITKSLRRRRTRMDTCVAQNVRSGRDHKRSRKVSRHVGHVSCSCGCWSELNYGSVWSSS